MLRMVTADGSLEGVKNKAFLGILIALVVFNVVNLLGTILMWGGHGGIPHGDYSDSVNPSKDDYGAVYDKGNRLAYSGFICFLVMWGGILYLVAGLTKNLFCYDFATAYNVIVLSALMVAAEQVDRVTFFCRHEDHSDGDLRKHCRNSRNTYIAGTFFTWISYVAFLILGLVLKWLSSSVSVADAADYPQTTAGTAGYPTDPKFGATGGFGDAPSMPPPTNTGDVDNYYGGGGNSNFAAPNPGYDNSGVGGNYATNTYDQGNYGSNPVMDESGPPPSITIDLNESDDMSKHQI